MGTLPLKYKVRSGTIDLGREYEWKIPALLCLRCVLRIKEDWWIALNADGVGAFDDVILHCGKTSFMIQLKHKQNPKNILETEYLAPKGDFSLKKYLHDISLFKKSSPSKNTELIKQLGLFASINFVIYTNRGTHDCSFLKSCSDSTLSLLKTANNSNVFKFDSTELNNISDVSCDNFFLCADQLHSKDMEAAIMKEISQILAINKVLGDSQVIGVNEMKDMVEKFLKFIEDWAKGDLGGHYCLTKTDVICKLTELALSDYKIDFRAKMYTRFHNDYRKTLWEEMISDKIVTVVDSDKMVLDFLLKYIGSEIELSNKPCENRKWSYCLSDQELSLLFNINPSLKFQMLKIVGNCKQITLFEIYYCLWMIKKLPLLLEIRNVDDYQYIINVLELSNYLYNVVIINSSGLLLPDLNKISHFNTVEDLAEEHQEEILENSGTFQGRPNVRLGDLIDRDVFCLISTSDVINILQNNFSIGNDLKPLPEYHIERTLSKICVKLEILTEVIDEVFVIEGNFQENRQAFPTIDNSKVCKLEEVANGLDKSVNVIFSNRSVTQKDLQNLHKVAKKSVHILNMNNTHNLIWKSSVGSTERITKFVMESEPISVSNFISSATENVIIISETSGMGKTMLMDYITHVAPSNKLVLKINLNEHSEHYKSSSCKTEETDAVVHLQYFKKKLFEKCKFDELSNLIFEKLIRRKDVMILMDGFDEIAICYKREVTNIAKSLRNAGFQIWLTTRCLMRFYLENEFQTTSTTLTPFTANNQHKFLVTYFSTVNADLAVNLQTIVEDFVKKLLNEAKKNLTDEDGVFTGIPLQTKLLAEYFNEDCRKCLVNRNVEHFDTNFSLLDLYQSFIDKKIEIVVEKYGTAARDISEMFVEDQLIFALKLLFPQHDRILNDRFSKRTKDCHKTIHNLQKDGVLAVDEQYNIHFVHRTFAEFVVAKWMTENFNSVDENTKKLVEVLFNERFSGSYTFLFSIFDRFLAAECPVHLAIINGQAENAIEILKSEPQSITVLDKGKRSYLHLVALYNVQYPAFIDDTSQFKMLRVHLNESRAAMVLKPLDSYIFKNNKLLNALDLFGYNPFDYAISNRCFYFANKLCEKLNISITKFINLQLKQSYLGCCIFFGFNSLLRCLLTYFIRNEVLLGKVHKDSSVYFYLQVARRGWHSAIESYKRRNRRTSLNFVMEFYGHYDYTKDFEDCTLTEYLWPKQVNNYYLNLQDAVVGGTDKNVKQLILDGTDINKQDVYGNVPLHYAALHKKVEIVDILISEGAKTNITNTDDETVLHSAVKIENQQFNEELLKKRRDIVELLISNDVAINAINSKGNTALHCLFENNAFEINYQALSISRRYTVSNIPKVKHHNIIPLLLESNWDIMMLLISKNANVNIRNKQGETLFHYQIKKNYDDILNDILSGTKLINILNSINCTDIYGNTLLHIASQRNSFKTVELLLKNGANPSIENKKGYCPVHFAVVFKRINLLEEFCKHATIEQNDSKGNTLLHLSLLEGNISVAKYLISNGANVDAETNLGETVLQYAIELNLDEIIPNILDHTLDVNKLCSDGNTALHLSLLRGRSSIAELLTSKGANINAKNIQGKTAFHCAVESNLEDIIPRFMNGVTDIDSQCDDGNTALHLSLIRKHSTVVELLIRNGAKVNVKNKQGKTALHCAVESNLMDAPNIILPKIENIDAQDNDGNTCLHIASAKNYLDSTKLLVASGASINAKNREDHTPLHRAARYGSAKTFEFLFTYINMKERDDNGNTHLHMFVQRKLNFSVGSFVSNGSDINAQNDEGKTALHLAVLNNMTNILIDLVNYGAFIDAKDENGNTPLHLAAMVDNKDIVQALFDADADMDIRNNDNESVQFLAYKKNNPEIVCIFQEQNIRRFKLSSISRPNRFSRNF